MGERIKLKAGDGFVLNAYRAAPPGKPKAGVVLIQEVWGLNRWIRSEVDRYASEGYLTVAPAMMDRVETGRRTIANFHNPPYASGLDTAPELDKNLKPVLHGGRPSFIPVGSRAVREAIKKYQPSVGLHGHIHESRGAQKIGQTLCLNPGSEYSADVLRGAIVDIAADGSCLDFLLTAG